MSWEEQTDGETEHSRAETALPEEQKCKVVVVRLFPRFRRRFCTALHRMHGIEKGVTRYTGA